MLQVLFVAFLIALLQPAIPNPFLLEPAAAWTLVCCAFAIPVVVIHVARGWRRQPASFDWALGAYLVCVFVAWPASVNRHATAVAIVTLLGQIAVFYAVRRRWLAGCRARRDCGIDRRHCLDRVDCSRLSYSIRSLCASD